MGGSSNNTNLYLPTSQNSRLPLPSAEVNQQLSVVDTSGLSEGVRSLASSMAQVRNTLEEVTATQDYTLLQQDIKSRENALKMQLEQVNEDGLVDVDGVQKPLSDLVQAYDAENQEKTQAFQQRYNSVRLANLTTQSSSLLSTAKVSSELLHMTAEHAVSVNRALIKEEEVQQSYLKTLTPLSQVEDVERVIQEYGEHLNGLGLIGLDEKRQMRAEFGRGAVLGLVLSSKREISEEPDPEKRLAKLEGLDKKLKDLAKSETLTPYFESVFKSQLDTSSSIGQEREAIQRQKERDFELYHSATLLQAEQVVNEAESSGYTPNVVNVIGTLKKQLNNPNLNPVQKQQLNTALSGITLSAWFGGEQEKMSLMGVGELESYAQSQIESLGTQDPYYLQKRKIYADVLKADSDLPKFPNSPEEVATFVGKNGYGAYIGLSQQAGVMPSLLEWNAIAKSRIKQSATAGTINGANIASDVNGAVSMAVQNGVDVRVAEVKAYQEVAAITGKAYLQAMPNFKRDFRGQLLQLALSTPTMTDKQIELAKQMLLNHKGSDNKQSALSKYTNSLLQNGRGAEYNNFATLVAKLYYADLSTTRAGENPEFTRPTAKNNRTDSGAAEIKDFTKGFGLSKEHQNVFLDDMASKLSPFLETPIRGYDPKAPKQVRWNDPSRKYFPFNNMKSGVMINQNTVAWLGGVDLPPKFRTVKVTSGLRSAEKNQAVGGVAGSSHLDGSALDLNITKPDAWAIEGLVRLAQSGRVGYMALPPNFSNQVGRLKKVNPNLQIELRADHSDHVHIQASNAWKQQTKLLSNWRKISSGEMPTQRSTTTIYNQYGQRLER